MPAKKCAGAPSRPAYYEQWILLYSDKIKPLFVNLNFSLSTEALNAFKLLKSELAEVSLGVINEGIHQNRCFHHCSFGHFESK